VVPAKNKYADSKSSAYLLVVENKEVPDSNIGVPPVRKYANYRTLLSTVQAPVFQLWLLYSSNLVWTLSTKQGMKSITGLWQILFGLNLSPR
jgi:hypothetical protein